MLSTEEWYSGGVSVYLSNASREYNTELLFETKASVLTN